MKQTQLMTHGEMQLTTKIRVIPWKYLPLCATTGVIVFIMNYFCRINDSDVLKWILAPTARWAGVLGGIYFEYLPHRGYVNYFHQFLIAPSCAGTRFMLLALLMLLSLRLSVFRSGNRQPNMQKEYLWFASCIVFSYIFTVFVNGIRIAASIYLPDVMERLQLMNGWLTSDRLHTLIGTGTYFTFLCLIYLLASFVHGRIFMQEESVPFSLRYTAMSGYLTEHKRLIVPVFWYLLIVLAVPFIKRIYYNEWEGFVQYAAVIVGVCGSVYVLFAAVLKIRRRRHEK